MDPDSAAVRNEMAMYQQERDFFKQQYENLKASLAQPIPQVIRKIYLCAVCFKEGYSAPFCFKHRFVMLISIVV